jgi:hypothetical protein
MKRSRGCAESRENQHRRQRKGETEPHHAGMKSRGHAEGKLVRPAAAKPSLAEPIQRRGWLAVTMKSTTQDFPAALELDCL